MEEKMNFPKRGGRLRWVILGMVLALAMMVVSCYLALCVYVGKLDTILPGVYAGEVDVGSFVGIAVKGPLKARMNYIENLIMQYGGRPAFPGMYQQPVMQNPYQPPQSSQMPLSGNAQAHSDRAAFCTDCGSALTQDSKFCAVCGKKVE